MRTFLTFSVVLILTACSPSTKLVSSWSESGHEPHKFQKLMVMAVFPNMETRAAAENAMVDALVAKGVRAMVTYDAFPLAGNAKDLMEMARDSAQMEELKQGFREKVKRKGADGLMIISVFDVEKTKEYHQGGPTLVVGAPTYGYYSSGYGTAAAPFGQPTYYDYYGYNVAALHSQGHYTTSATYYLQNNLFDVNTEQLVYAGQTKTVDYKSLQKEAALLSDLMVNDLHEKKVLAFREDVVKK